MTWSVAPSSIRRIYGYDLLLESWNSRVAAHEKANPQHVPKRIDGTVIPEGTPSSELLLPGQQADLPIHPEAAAEQAATNDN